MDSEESSFHQPNVILPVPQAELAKGSGGGEEEDRRLSSSLVPRDDSRQMEESKGSEDEVSSAIVKRAPGGGTKREKRVVGVGFKEEQGGADGQHPRTLLPTEIWDEVFNLVTDSRDWLHCYYSSASFQKEPWLKWKERRKHRLFSAVVRIINKRNLLEESDYLACRRVSKSWKVAVDDFLQHSTLQFCLSSTPEKPWVDLWTSIEFFDSNSAYFFAGVEYWMTRPASVNPFPSRQLEFWDMHVTEEKRPQFKLATQTFLTKFGHHLWYFSYHACRDDLFSSPVDWYITVRRWLECMPNLKKICLAYGGENNVLDNALLVELEETVGSNPFPPFDSLITLETEYLPYSVLNSAIAINTQIKRLEQHPNSYRLQWTNFANFHLNQLTEFTTQLYTLYDVHQLRQTNWPLQTLNIRCWNVNLEQNWNFGEIIETIHHFQATLKSLRLEVTMIDPGVELELPFLEQLDLECDNDGNHFIPLVRNLKSLTKIGLSVDLSGSEQHNIAFETKESHMKSMKCHVHRVFAAPLWELIPCLKTVFVQTYVTPFRVMYDYTYKRGEDSC